VLNRKAFSEGFGGRTVVLKDSSTPPYTGVAAEAHFPHLLRTKTQESISIATPVFRLGKDKLRTDYAVVDNSAVSRRHADIITEGKRYYVVDHGSTNGTFVGFRRLQPEKEEELFAGTKLRLANEEFIFYV